MNKRKKVLVFLFGLVLIIGWSGIVSLKLEEKPKLDLRERIYLTELMDVLEDGFPQAMIVIMDNWYYLVNEDDMNTLMEYDKTNEHKYVKEVYDCDDFAFDFWRNVTRHYHIALGVAFVKTLDGRSHAINFYIGEDYRIHFIEPQLDIHISGGSAYFVLI